RKYNAKSQVKLVYFK
ncbi:hypothetical protein, partial [Escherichia coli]